MWPNTQKCNFSQMPLLSFPRWHLGLKEEWEVGLTLEKHKNIVVGIFRIKSCTTRMTVTYNRNQGFFYFYRQNYTSSTPGPDVSPRGSGGTAVDSFCVPSGHVWCRQKGTTSQQLDWTGVLLSHPLIIGEIINNQRLFMWWTHFFSLHLRLGSLLK